MSVADEIEKLARLREQGVLTEAEFEQQKQLALAQGQGQVIDEIDARVPNVAGASPVARPGPGPAAGQGPQKSSKLAILAIVLACLFFIPFVPLIGALLGIAALVRLRSHPELSGRGAAIAAIPAGFVIFFVIQAMMSAIAIPAFIKYIRKSKTVEATEGLYKLAAGARAAARADRYDQAGRLLPHGFPVADTGWVPATSCCDQGVKCVPAAADWAGSPWRELHFQLQDPHYFQYRYASGGQSFEVEARGDLDCDGVFSSYVMQGSVDSQGEVSTRGPIITNEIE